MPIARVVEVVAETTDAHSLVLEPDEPMSYRAGQFLTVRVPSDHPDHPAGAARCYSLCSSPVLDEPMKVTVKRTREGYASNWICDHVVAGSELEILKPAGTFVPHDFDHDLLLLAGGSGVTPVMSILKSVLHGGRGSIHLVYANRDEQSIIFKDQLDQLTRQFPGRLSVVHWLESVQGIPHAGALRPLLAPYRNREAYLCGPAAFMDLGVEVLSELGAQPGRVHTERFHSLDGDPFAEVEIDLSGGDGPVGEIVVTLDGQTSTVPWPAETKLLDVLLAAGLDAPYSCREGHCSACACVKSEGEVELEHNEILDSRDLEDGLILACQARALTERVVVSFDN